MKNYIIDVDHVSKKFKENQVLDKVCIHCESGKIYGIVGYNGSGKTVLFKCICGFYPVDSGNITINGKQMGTDIGMIQDAGILIEEPGYLRSKSGFKNLAFLYQIKNKIDKEHIREIMKKVGLDPDSRKTVENYSLGMRQRLAIAQAIMEEQQILILDEPMNGLDKAGIAEMRTLLSQMKEEGKLIILASHNKEDIDILCDEVYEMDAGILKCIRSCAQ